MAEPMSEPFSTPAGAPLVPELPIRFRQTEILSIWYRSDPDAIEALLPRPLEAVSDIVLVHFYAMHDPDRFGPHREFAMQLDARIPGSDVRGAYSPYIMLSTDGGLATGREIYGQPKKLGSPSLEARGDLMVGIAARNGIDVVTGTMPYKPAEGAIEDLTEFVPFATNLNLKIIPHVTGEPAVRQLTARTLSDIVVHECHRGPATIHIVPNAQFPAHRLPVLAMGDGYHWRSDFTLPFGRVVHDYLAASTTPAPTERSV
jgi:acetoacetate decarboxylase